MNNCYSCTTCKSADKPLEGYIAGLPHGDIHHRVEGQSVKCTASACRASAAGYAQRPLPDHPERPHGICGASAT